MTDTSETLESYDVVVTRTFEAPVSVVWQAWTDGEQVKRWWGPRPFTAPVARMDVRAGGTSLVCMRAPKEMGGQDYYNTWTYSEVVPNERLEYVLNFADQHGATIDPRQLGLPPGIPLAVPHVVTLKAVGAGRTEMTVSESGYTTNQARDISKAGLEQCLDKMAETFAT